ncbi:hypothetical protein L1987_21501 [Smallanthus sonchifolius]|uniref:Uncharacterized protein n=1 Tax=Smallanthus sonchifolius TaxID=185202 RepID=A0ACB9IWF0_9ASTR|nr:hypothetical protein L1987_21501 [Smallanthus sonchifolius]
MPRKEKDFEVASCTSTAMGSSNSSQVMDIDELMTKRFEMAMGSSQTSLKKSELDKYLGEDREPKDPHLEEGMKDLVLEQPTIIIDETIDETSEVA